MLRTERVYLGGHTLGPEPAFDNVDALRAWLQTGSRRRLEIHLSARWCQYFVLPWSGAMADPVAAQRFARAQLQASLGEASGPWRIVSDSAPYGQARLACAIPEDLAQSIEQAAQAAGARLSRVEPSLAYVWRRLGKRRPTLLAVLESGRLSLAMAQGGRLVAAHTVPVIGPWQTALAQAWQRWRLREPALAAIDDLGLVRLDAKTDGAPPAGFRLLTLEA